MSSLQMKWQAIQQLTRLDKPIGTYLLLWPTYWALWIACDGWPNLHLLLVFTFGVVVMRSAGCVINDVADRNIDGQVERTQHRPLVSGLVTSQEAMALFGFLIGVGSLCSVLFGFWIVHNLFV